MSDDERPTLRAVATDRDADDAPGANALRGGPLDGRRSWAPAGRGQGPTGPAAPAGDDHVARLVEALATVLGRRLDTIDTRLDALAEGEAADIGGRLDRLDQRLDELFKATVERTESARRSPGQADPSLGRILARLEAIEGRLAARPAPPPSGQAGRVTGADEALARVEDRLDQLNRLLLG